MVFGVLAFIVTLTVAGGIQQYSSKPDIVGQQAKTVEQVNLYLPFQSERVFQYLFLKILQNLRKNYLNF